MTPGQLLVELELASQLNVSRAPIREALHILHSEGLVEIIPYHKTYVRQITQKDVEELYDICSLLETLAIRRIIALNDRNMTPPLRQLYTDMVNAADKGDLKHVSDIDRSFHDTLIELSYHNMLQHTWMAVSFWIRQVMALRRLRRKIVDNQEIKQIAQSHLPIIEAIAEGNEVRAVNLIQEHIATSGDLIAADWEDSNVTDSD